MALSGLPIPAVLTLLGDVLVAIFDFLVVGDFNGELVLNFGDEEIPKLVDGYLISGVFIKRPSLLIRIEGFLYI